VTDTRQGVDLAEHALDVVLRAQLDLLCARQEAHAADELTDCVWTAVKLVPRFDNFSEASFALASDSSCRLCTHEELDLLKVLAIARVTQGAGGSTWIVEAALSR
jgi:hypothetical protein